MSGGSNQFTGIIGYDTIKKRTALERRLDNMRDMLERIYTSISQHKGFKHQLINFAHTNYLKYDRGMVVIKLDNLGLSQVIGTGVIGTSSLNKLASFGALYRSQAESEIINMEIESRMYYAPDCQCVLRFELTDKLNPREVITYTQIISNFIRGI